MQKNTTERFSPLKLFQTLTLLHLASVSMAQAAEQPVVADPHDTILKSLVKQHSYSHNHFITQQDKPVPLFDVTKEMHQRAGAINSAQAKRYRDLTTPTLPESIPSIASQNNSSSLGSILWTPFSYLGTGAMHVAYSPYYLYSAVVSSRSPQKTELAKEESSSSTTALLPSTSSPSLTIAQKDQDSASLQLSPGRIPELIASLDGGGVRGLIEALIIERMERETNMPFAVLFDLIAGSSSGGMNAVALAMGKTGSELVKLYTTDSEKIFYKPSRFNVPANIMTSLKSLYYSRYDPQPFEQYLQQILGDTQLSQARTNLYITTLNITTNSPDPISNITNPTDLAWKTVRKTSAAPTKFPAFEDRVDGGLWENHPGFEALVFARNYSIKQGFKFDPFENSYVFSIGTGMGPFKPIPHDAGVMDAGPIVDACITSQVIGTDFTLKSILNKRYTRLNPVLESAVHLDQLEGNVELLTSAAESQFGAVEEFVHLEVVRKRLEAKK